MSLRVDDFEKFHAAVHDGRRPFEWQSRLLREIIGERAWPSVLDLPTGSGKTTCIDIALFALAHDAAKPPAKRWCPRRIIMVVDRRVVVDQVAERGRKLARALLGAKSDVLREVASALRSLMEQEADSDVDPVGVFTLRGGMPKDDGWARSPDQPLILASTVDQLGSKILLRGYGVKATMLPIHAGLLSNDTLVLLDEVHLSQPFADTLDQLEKLRAPFHDEKASLPNRFHHVFLSATPGSGMGKAFKLKAPERSKNSELGPRLHANKPARILQADNRTDLEFACVREAKSVSERHQTVLVVMNRIASARIVAKQLRETHPDRDVVLLTGRMRPLDRDNVMTHLLPRVRTGRDRAQVDRRLIVVATQCVEAGADFDFDAIVTEAASLDALRQRFGRVDRLGEYKNAEGCIVALKEKNDPIYGDAIPATIKYLREQGKKNKSIDFGVEALSLPKDPEEHTALIAPKPRAPILLPAYLDLWEQTSPEPSTVPDVSLWLHGPQSGPADVQVVWRADLSAQLLSGDFTKEERERRDEIATAIVSSVLPSSLEAMSIPIGAVKAWLSGNREADRDVADVELSTASAEQRTARTRVLRWEGDESEIIDPQRIRPGDTIIVPAAFGGVSEGSFDPTCSAPVRDLAEQASFLARATPQLRLHPEVLRGLELPIELADNPDAALVELARRSEDAPKGWRKAWLGALERATGRVIDEDGRDIVVLKAPRLSTRAFRSLRRLIDPGQSIEDGVEITTDDEESYCAGRAVSLSEHSDDVERKARIYAQGVGLSDGLVEDIALAGWLHDIGKADRRFQILLRGGSEIAFMKDETPLAKSVMAPGDASGRKRARRASGYPNGARHEVQSLAMLEQHMDEVKKRANDLDLVLHLVASHHGYCRPFAPVAPDPTPIDVTLVGHRSKTFKTLSFTKPTSSANGQEGLGAEHPSRFWRLVRKYGWLELCWLEAILRLADHRASQEEQEAP